ncbi:MAG: hypothetical protein D6758_01605 [Gammaproteobacteria bacterium]|nr:MAG: hypothetical protein D6758_01605 [Gammaproteobacteria bacterium]
MTRILFALAAVIAAVTGYWLLSAGYDDIRAVRQLERIVPTPVYAVTGGETLVEGTAVKWHDRVRSRHTGTPSLYYRYLHEVEKRDSDGNTYWSTAEDIVGRVDFKVTDTTGEMVVFTQDGAEPVTWTVPQRFRQTRGKHRYTEWRLEEGDRVAIFGFAQLEPVGMALRLDKRGQYRPIVSTEGEAAARNSLGIGALFKLWGGLSLLALALFGGYRALNQHRLLGYLSLMSAVLAVILLSFGLSMMKSDLQGALDRFAMQKENSWKLASHLLWEAGVRLGTEDALPSALEGTQVADALRARITDIYTRLAASRARIERDFKRFPERWLVPLWGLKVPALDPDLPVNTAELSRLANVTPTVAQGGWLTWIYWGTLVLGLALFFWAFRWVRVKRMIENIPTTDVAGVVPGINEVAGTLTPLDPPLNGPLTHTPCCWFNYVVEERQGSGKNARWVTIENRTEYTLFQVEDMSGKITVDPDGAEIVTRHKNTERRGDMRYTERRLEPSDVLYVLGQTSPRQDNPAQLVFRHDPDVPFIVANEDEETLMLRKATAGMVLVALGFAGVLLSALLGFGQSGGFAPTDFLAAAMISPALLILATLILHYNDLVFLRQRVRRNRANIDVVLQKRFDLIPNLEKVASRYLRHEQALQTGLARLRTLPQAQEGAEQVLHHVEDELQTLGRFRGAVEAYPQLKAQPVIGKLMALLTKVEDELAQMRAGLALAIERYETRRESFPDVIIARLFRFEPAAHLQAEQAARSAPAVRLDSASGSDD